MTELSKYRVIMCGTVMPEKSRAEVLDALVELFNSDRNTMEQLLIGKEVPLIKEYNRANADKIRRLIRRAGAQCKVLEIKPSEVAEREAAYARVDSEQDAPTQPQPDRRADPQTEQQADQQTDQQTSALMRFVAVNTDYYRRQFAKFSRTERPTFAFSWHWPAFLAFFFWAMYRKLWHWAAINLIGGLVLVVLVEPGFIHLAWALCWPLVANYLYYLHVCKHVHAHKSDPAVLFNASPGGVSHAALWVAMIVMFVLSLALNSTVTEQILEQYNGTENVLPDSGLQQRGDGSLIDEGTLGPRFVKTMAILNGIATALKLAASNKALDDTELALSIFKRVLEKQKFKDAWGTAIRLQHDASGQIALISAGPDRSFDNEDDILRYIQLDGL